MHQVLANYTLPAILNTLQPAAANGLKKALSAHTAPTSGTTSSSAADGGLGSTFLNLLATELQNQDPTAPVDSTAMVGQMISLNQLDQLISINQVLTTSAGTTGTTGSGATPAPTASLASANGNIPADLSPSTAAAAAAVNQLPFDPTTLMPLNFGNAAAAAASINSSVNASMGSSATNHNTSGGK
jgi:flagellar basal-body rod modification protein FlgD